MAVTRNPDATTEAPRDRFQFSIRQMLVLTAVSAVMAAMVRSMCPLIVFQGVIDTYLILMAAYVVLRLPYICRRIMYTTRQWGRIQRQRSDLEAMILNRKREIERRKLMEDAGQPQTPPAADKPGG